MPLDRREFLQGATGGLVTTLLASGPVPPAGSGVPIQAVAFDAFPIFDPRPVFALAETLFPGKGIDLSNAWRTRQFEYQWLRVMGGRYADFWRTTEDGLVFAARQLQLELTSEKRDQLMQAYLALKAWPDVPPALRALKDDRVRLVFLSNMTKKMLERGIQNARLDGMFEHVLSTDAIRTYKPDPRAYQMGIDALGLKREEILFAPFAGWDAAGAKWFGYPTFWVNRANSPVEELGVAPDGTGRDLTELLAFVRRSR
jgi:2-haloacid dehalogenase